MPKKKKGGKKKKRSSNVPRTRNITLKTDGQEYAQVQKMLGDRRVECMCFDGIDRLCHIRGSMRKRCWIKVDDIVIIALRSFNGTGGDIIHRYHPPEVRKLQKMGEIPDTITIAVDDEEDAFIFSRSDDELDLATI
jgi:translation initiation factor 1A